MSTALERVSCYLCASAESEPWAREHGYSAVKCAGCGLVYVTPRPSTDTIDESSMTGEHATDREAINVTGTFRPRKVRRLRKDVGGLYADVIHRAAPVRWLDIGAGHGELAVALHSILPFGSDVVAMEPNAAKRRSSATHGVVAAASLSEVHGSFDVISMINVYSHLPDPVRFIREMSEHLRPGGSMLLETGNGGDLERREDYPDALYLPDHLSFVGEAQLSLLADKAGLRVERVKRYRVDHVLAAVGQCVKMVLRRPYRLIVPYTSPFRSLVVRLQSDAG